MWPPRGHAHENRHFLKCQLQSYSTLGSLEADCSWIQDASQRTIFKSQCPTVANTEDGDNGDETLET